MATGSLSRLSAIVHAPENGRRKVANTAMSNPDRPHQTEGAYEQMTCIRKQYCIINRMVCVAIGYVAWAASAGVSPCVEPWDASDASRHYWILLFGGLFGGFRPITAVWSVPLEIASGLRAAHIIWEASCGFPGDPQIGIPLLVFVTEATAYALPASLVLSGFGSINVGAKRKPPEEPRKVRHSSIVMLFVGVLLMLAPVGLMNAQAIADRAQGDVFRIIASLRIATATEMVLMSGVYACVIACYRINESTRCRKL